MGVSIHKKMKMNLEQLGASFNFTDVDFEIGKYA